MPRFVRCIEGHMFDADASSHCPVCGVPVATAPPPAPSVEKTTPAAPGQAPPQPGKSQLPMLIAIAAVGFGLGAAALVFVLRAPSPSPHGPAVEHVAEQSASAKPGQAPASANADHAAPASKPTDQPPPTQAATVEHSAEQSAPAKPAQVPAPASADQAPTKKSTDQPAAPQAPPAEHAAAEQSAPARPTQAPAPVSAENKVADSGKPAAAPDTAKPTAPAVAAPAPDKNQPANAAAPQATVTKQAALEHPVVSPPPTLAANISIDDAIKASAAIMRMYAYALQRHDYSKAAEIARDLAAKNNPIGLFELGVLNLGGQLGSKDPAAARKYFSEAAKLGDWNSAALLAQLLENGAGGPQDIESAKPLYLFAARNGNADADRALARLGLSGERGLTVGEAYNNIMAGKDLEASWQRLNEQIAAHSSGAICLAGWIYGSGASVPRDANRAFDLFKAGAETDNPSCIWGLSRTVVAGLPGLPKSEASADVLLHVAILGLGPERSKGMAQEMDALEKRMSAEDKARAQEILQEITEAAAPTADAAESKSGFSPQAWQSAPHASGNWSREELARAFVSQANLKGMERARVEAQLGKPGSSGLGYPFLGAEPDFNSDVYRLNATNDHSLIISYDTNGKVQQTDINAEANACACDTCSGELPGISNDAVENVLVKKYPRKNDHSVSIAQFEALLGRGGKRSVKYQPSQPAAPSSQPTNDTSSVEYEDTWRIEGGAPHRFLLARGFIVGRPFNPNAPGEWPLSAFLVQTMQPECLAP